MSANAHDMARTASRGAGEGRDDETFEVLDSSLAQLEAKLAALQSRADEAGRSAPQRPKVSAPPMAPPMTPAMAAPRAPAFAEPRPAPVAAPVAWSEPAAPASEAPSTVIREIGRMRNDVSEQIGRRMEGLARQVSDLRGVVANNRGPELKPEFDRIYRGLEAVADALDKQGSVGNMARDVASLKAEVDGLRALSASQAKIEKSQGVIERSLAAHHAAIDPELASIRAQLEDVSRKIAGDKSGAALKGVDERLVSLGKTLAEVKRVAGEGPDLRRLEAKLEDLARVVVAASQAAPQIDPAHIERVEARVAQHTRKIDERDKRREQLDAERHQQVGTRFDALREETKANGAAVREIASGLDKRLGEFTETVRDEHGRLAMDIAAATAPRFDHVAQSVDAMGGRVDEWGQRLDGWGRHLEQQMGRPRDAEVNMFKALAARLDAVSDRLAELPDAQADNRNWTSIEARVNAVLQRLDHLPAGMDNGAMDELRSQLGSIAWRLEQPAEAPAALTALDGRITALSEQIDMLGRMNAEASANAGDFDDGVIARIGESVRKNIAGDITGDLEERIGGRVEDSLTVRLNELTEVLGRTTAPIAELGPRMDALEESMGDAQVALVESARSAAADVVRSMLESQADMVPAEAEAVAALDDDIKRLESLTVHTDERNNKTFDAVHETLLKIVDRLDQLDTMVSRATEAPDPAVVAATHAALMGANAAAAPASSSNPSLMDRIRGRAAQPAGEANAPVADPVAEVDAPSLFGKAPAAMPAGLHPDTPLDPTTGEPRFDPPGIDGATGEPTVEGIVERVRASEAAEDDDFMAVARRKAQTLSADAEFTGTLSDAKDGPASKKGKAKAARKGKKALAGDNANEKGSALARYRTPMLLAAAVAIAALIAVPQINGMIGGIMGETPEAARPASVDIKEIVPAVAIDAPAEASMAPVDPLAGEDVAIEGPADAEAAVEADTFEEIAADVEFETVPVNTAVDPTLTQSVDPVEETAAAVRDVTAPVEVAIEEASELSVAGPVTDIAFEAADGPAPLRAAAKGGDARALHEIAGRIAATDAERALRLYRAAAVRGLAPAQYRLGQAHEKGYGTEIDLAKAREWYARAAEAGNVSAMHNLAVLYAMGADGERDVTLAGRWFTEAANRGVKDSQYNLGILHAQGSGVSEDLTESYKWFDAAAKAGDDDANAKRDEVAGAMSASQLAAAKAKVLAWRAKTPDAAVNTVTVPDAWRAAPLAAADMKKAVRNVQAILNKAGFDAGTPDGVMGKKTRTAIVAFQQAEGLRPTGEIDDALVKALLERNG